MQPALRRLRSSSGADRSVQKKWQPTIRSASTCGPRQAKFLSVSQSVTRRLNNLHSMRFLIGTSNKRTYTTDAGRKSLKMCLKDTMVRYSRTVRLVLEKLTRWLVLKPIRTNRVSCLDHSKMCSRGSIRTRSKLNSWSEQVTSKFTTKKLGICSQRIPKIDSTCMRSLTLAFM